jgi:DNA-binding LacI/PurR family transcriptional regulator
MVAGKHLVDLGHTRIGTIIGPRELLCCQARLDGFCAALKTAGLPTDPELVDTSGSLEGPEFEETLATAMAMLSVREPPTAIFAGSDVKALAVYQAAHIKGLQVPDDLSVVGFDDIPMASWASPPLTTLRQPLFEVGALAVRTLIEHDPDSFSHGLEMSTTLVIRSSTKALSPKRREPQKPVA